MNPAVETPLSRVDVRHKVTGAARYTAEITSRASPTR